MMTLPKIAADMRLTQQNLRDHEHKDSHFMLDVRRAFVRRAFSEGHDPEPICEFIDRKPVMVTHALRMSCLDSFGGDYGRSLTEMASLLRGLPALPICET
jgi:hypothetical protein